MRVARSCPASRRDDDSNPAYTSSVQKILHIQGRASPREAQERSPAALILRHDMSGGWFLGECCSSTNFLCLPSQTLPRSVLLVSSCVLKPSQLDPPRSATPQLKSSAAQPVPSLNPRSATLNPILLLVAAAIPPRTHRMIDHISTIPISALSSLLAAAPSRSSRQCASVSATVRGIPFMRYYLANRRNAAP